ncbi:hypothetical protein FHY15_002115 [Xanthomonas arboricola]|nr:hypothetical protein [Xanthomonas arboricola]NJC01612.1 hypothetical protein [Xanthomonas arboricola]
MLDLGFDRCLGYWGRGLFASFLKAADWESGGNRALLSSWHLGGLSESYEVEGPEDVRRPWRMIGSRQNRPLNWQPFFVAQRHGNDSPRRQRGRGLAESGTGMCRGGESDRMSDRAEEPVHGRAVALTEAGETQPRAWQCPGRETVPSPHPLAPRPDPRLRRGRSQASAPMARKPCRLAPAGERLQAHRVVQNSGATWRWRLRRTTP